MADDRWRDTYDAWKLASPYDDYDEPEEECWQCGGEGYIANCQDECACVDPESGCDLCTRRCDICNPRKAPPATPPAPAPDDEIAF